MSRKYIRQQIIQDFVYPNNDIPQYDVDNIVHEINGNSVSGTINSLNTVSISSTGITLTLNYTWNLNNAEPFINNANLLGLVSVHALPPTQQYYKPWRLVQSTTNANTNITTITQSTTFTITPSMFGLSVFTNGKYYFEVRFIGHRSVYPVCTNLDITIPIVTPTPTPTPTITPTPGGPTPTPTPTPGTPTPTPTPTEAIYTEYSFCGRGNSVSESCNDAAINNRTFYSNCNFGSFGVGCYVYIDPYGTLLTGYTNIFMNGANWDIDTSTGIVTAYSSIQC